MNAVWTTIVVLIFTTIAFRAAGPVAVGGRDLPPAVVRVISLLAPALLAALVVVETFGGEGKSLTMDARAAGLALAGALHVATESQVGAMLSAAGATALVRLIS
jgi:branched-subunit amino acid transport protein